jgi:hypothetical protein
MSSPLLFVRMKHTLMESAYQKPQSPLTPLPLSPSPPHPLFCFPRVFTVFSTSRDHGQGASAVAGCILVDTDKIHVINRSPAYKNKYIHHRTSIGCDLSDDQLLEISRLGLLRMDSLERRA